MTAIDLQAIARGVLGLPKTAEQPGDILTARRVSVDPTLPKPGWRFYQPVDLLRVFKTPDGVGRTLHSGVYQTIPDAQEAAGVTVWVSTGNGRWLSECGMWRIQPVSI